MNSNITISLDEYNNLLAEKSRLMQRNNQLETSNKSINKKINEVSEGSVDLIIYKSLVEHTEELQIQYEDVNIELDEYRSKVDISIFKDKIKDLENENVEIYTEYKKILKKIRIEKEDDFKKDETIKFLKDKNQLLEKTIEKTDIVDNLIKYSEYLESEYMGYIVNVNEVVNRIDKNLTKKKPWYKFW